jgi:hypothetical protein
MFIHARKGDTLIGQLDTSTGKVLRTYTGSRGGKYAEVQWDDDGRINPKVNLSGSVWRSKEARYREQKDEIDHACSCSF